MRKLVVTILLAAVASLCVSVHPAAATAVFQGAFIREYINNHKDPEFAKLVKQKAKCNICHRGKATPKNVWHNAYGKELVKLLDPKKDARNKEKIQKALQKVAKMHSDPEDEKSATFGEMIEKGQLPGGDLKESQRELTDEEKAKETEEHEKLEAEAAKAEADAKE
jgi:hypothetical protein